MNLAGGLVLHHQHAGTMKVRPDQKMVVMRDWRRRRD
jgi:hypothetical protein